MGKKSDSASRGSRPLVGMLADEVARSLDPTSLEFDSPKALQEAFENFLGKKLDPSAGAADTYERARERFRNDPTYVYKQFWAARLQVAAAPLAKAKPLDDPALSRVLNVVGAGYVPTTLNKAYFPHVEGSISG